ncbi:MAG: hypothetical protein FWD57_05855 [Polyangiaceae bacterium]|nr:hypothetical protein [Polyangiaceae bacterium]
MFAGNGNGVVPEPVDVSNDHADAAIKKTIAILGGICPADRNWPGPVARNVGTIRDGMCQDEANSAHRRVVGFFSDPNQILVDDQIGMNPIHHRA